MYSVHIGTTVILTNAQSALGWGMVISTSSACCLPEMMAFFIEPSMYFHSLRDDLGTSVRGEQRFLVPTEFALVRWRRG